MTPEQITRVQDSFEHIKPIADEAATLFYDRLFELDGSLRPLFSESMREHGRRLMRMLNAVVKRLHCLETILPIIQDLGQKHVTYGVSDTHYETAGAALLWTLEQGLGEAFTQEVREAWTMAYDALAGVMKNAAAEVQPVSIAA